MNDEEQFKTACVEVYKCAYQHFGGEELPESRDKCICNALSWITLSNSPPLRILGQKLIRRVLFLQAYHEHIVREILQRIDVHEPICLLELLTASPPSDHILQALHPHWPKIRRYFIQLLDYQCTEERVSNIQDMFKFWKRCLKATMAARGHLASELICLLNETVALLRGILALGAPAVSLLGCFNLLQKLVEIVCFDTWTFGLKLKRPGFVNDQLYNEVLSLLVDLKSASRVSSSDVEYFELEKFEILSTYVIARALYAYGEHPKLLARWLSIEAEQIIEMYAEDDVILFRMLITLLMIENKHLKSLGKNKSSIASAHDLFANMLKWINFDRHVIVDWLVSPETDCLTYLLAYTKRLGAASNKEIAPEYRDLWRPSDKWLEKHGEDVNTLFSEIVQSLTTLNFNNSLPFSPELLIANINNAKEILM
ncbi:unnamed protein product [Rodentolepis nana]|uniref:LINES_N domain-containing protein n=1 Tax=Rodentolepis nana TaxID=102285 RepID=A0A0R3TAD7_RODNA|nr:unnamed protein product [Rodentolepis nana]